MAMARARPRFLAAGDAGLVVEFGESIDRQTSARVLALQARIAGAGLPGIVELVPTFRSLLVHLDPDATDLAAAEAAISLLVGDLDIAEMPSRHWTIPVCYEPAFAPDIDAVAERTGLGRSQVVEAHSGREYHVYMIGFVPGYPYMGDLARELVLPRREDPRLRVPPGSVAIATTLTAIYPIESPGGWHIVGRTPVRLFDPERDPPALLRPGDKVRFSPIPGERFAEIAETGDGGTQAAGRTP